MNPFEFPVAIVGFAAFVMLMPAWMWFISNYASNLRGDAQFLATMVLPALIVLFVVSWIQPGG